MADTSEGRPSVSRRPLWPSVLTVLLAAAGLVLLLLLFASPALAPPPSFPDVPALHPYRAAIIDLAGRGIINGYTNGNFGPDDSVRRQQLAKMIVLTAGYPVTEADVCLFTDVEDSGPGSLFPENYVAVAAAHQITVGTAPGLFSPGAQISRYQVVTMLVRTADALAPGLLAQALGSFTSAPNWGDSPTHSASSRRAEFNGLFEGLDLASLDPWGNMSRGEVAQVLHNLLGKLPPPTTTTSGSTTSTTDAATTTTSSSTTTTSTSSTTITESPWAHFENLGGIHASAPFAISMATNQMDLIGRGSDNALWHKSFNGSAWSDWETLGGAFVGNPAAMSWNGRLYVFARGSSNNALEWQSYDGVSWAGWNISLGGQLAGDPVALSRAVDRVEVFARGSDDALWCKAFGLVFPGNQLGWQEWRLLGGELAGDPAAVTRGQYKVDVFARGADDRLWHNQMNNGALSGWGSLGGNLRSDPSAATDGYDVDIVARGSDNALWHMTYGDSGSSAWESLGGAFVGNPVVVSSGGGRLDVFGRGADNKLWYKSWNGSAWSGWISLGGALGGDPTAVSWATNRLSVFVLGPWNVLMHRWHDGIAWRP